MLAWGLWSAHNNFNKEYLTQFYVPLSIMHGCGKLRWGMTYVPCATNRWVASSTGHQMVTVVFSNWPNTPMGWLTSTDQSCASMADCDNQSHGHGRLPGWDLYCGHLSNKLKGIMGFIKTQYSLFQIPNKYIFISVSIPTASTPTYQQFIT